ncbi:hypothetical protein [Paenibacillus terrigena]|uniref:hypothetical protein n=1 Tax=Paenibacillus terrigena TaxID=369333 RepID=UPI0003816F94|nr:hypothetical protein [Paenibacillus terrigena]
MAKKPRVTAEQRKDWRNLPLDQWNVASIHVYFADMNRDQFGIETYIPMRNWRFEQGVVKRALETYGADLLKQAFDECFRTYRPSREFPLLTAGFCVAYRINSIMPKLLAEDEVRNQAQGLANSDLTTEEITAWL